MSTLSYDILFRFSRSIKIQEALISRKDLGTSIIRLQNVECGAYSFNLWLTNGVSAHITCLLIIQQILCMFLRIRLCQKLVTFSFTPCVDGENDFITKNE
ncbi:hypothetical protein T08_4569 [Trichinella sp. T8]|nr:hypothetical protein T08_4569 [Trichinella sp. T8]